jgi:hypothetical protein
MSLSRQEIHKILDEERDYQDAKYGGSIHDNQHTVSEWILFIRKHLNEAEDALYENDEKRALGAVRKITALGVAAMEVHTPPRRND